MLKILENSIIKNWKTYSLATGIFGSIEYVLNISINNKLIERNFSLETEP